MGCCASKAASSSPRRHLHASRSSEEKNAAAAQPVLLSAEEETVKEVLPESSNPKASAVARPEDGPRSIARHECALQKIGEIKIEDERSKKGAHRPDVGEVEKEEEAGYSRRRKPAVAGGADKVVPDEPSERSPAILPRKRGCKDDREGEFRRMAAERSLAKFRNHSFSGSNAKRDRVEANSPARSCEASPGRVKIVPGREVPGPGADGQRRNSPAKRTQEGTCRMRVDRRRRIGTSPGREGSELKRKTRRVDGPKVNKIGRNRRPGTRRESLENPVVSLECFIFL